MCVLLIAPAVFAEESAQQFADLGRCTLDSGQTIEHCRVGYRTIGKLNAAGDNAVLMPTWLNGRTEDMLSFAGAEQNTADRHDEILCSAAGRAGQWRVVFSLE